MPFRIYSLTCLFLIIIFIQSTICALPSNIQNLELDDITTLWDKFPSIIEKIKEAVSRFRCPKGWKRLGGSCYYLSNLTSTSTEANQTCNLLHSNHSNLMQIRNTVELFYAAHVLSRKNLTALMIDIDPSLLKGKKITEILMDDQGRWVRMKEKFREVRLQYQKLKKRIVDRLNSTGLRILRRSKKIQQIPTKKPKPQSIEDDVDPDHYHQYEIDHVEPKSISPNEIIANVSSIDDEYEYDDLDSSDESDEFEQIDDIRGICDQIDWNVLNNDSTVYVLTTYIISDKIVCSLSDVETDTEYNHVCEYVLDFCFANIVCGKHGQCVNTLAGFKCACWFLYGGLICEKISEQGYQIIISVIIILLLTITSFKPVRMALWFIVKSLIDYCKKHRTKHKQKQGTNNDDTQQLISMKRSDKVDKDKVHLQQRRQTIAQEFMELIRETCRCIILPKTANPLLNPTKRNLVRMCWVGILTVIFLSSLFIITTITHLASFQYDITDNTELELIVNDTFRLVTQCERISDYRRGNLIFFPVALALILIFSWSIKREKLCLDMCDDRPGLIPPIEPFRTGNRFTTATVFGILTYEVLKIFEDLLFSTGQPLNHGVLIELLERIAIVILVGLRYYPVLASLQLRNIIARFFACLYIIGDIAYTIVREGSCMGFLPLSGQYTALEEAKLRLEIGTWFIVYGLIKNIPHFFFLSYIGAELFVRFGYDSIYIPLKKHQSIWSAPVVQLDESEFAKYYVTKLFRRNHRSRRPTITTDLNSNPVKLEDHEHEVELQNQADRSRVKRFFNSIYHWDDDFRFTTMATCTYTVAIVFLYYLACTFVFLYVSRTTGHISFLRSYVESVLEIELTGTFSLKLEVILSAILTAIIYGFQLFIGMQNYKKHKLQIYKGIYVDVPAASNFKPNSIASNSVHYSGFLVGYMAWGFVICFHIIFFLLAAIRILSLQIRNLEIVLAIIVPVLLVYLLKIVSMSSAGRFLFIQKIDQKLSLKSRKTYAIFLYFSFFADCFLGIASCIIRLMKAALLNVVFMARLDWSFLGRPMEKFDLGFAAYVSYLHMEATCTHPIMLAFCYSMYDDVIQRRRKKCYDDECCIAPGELDDDDENGNTRQNLSRQNRATLTQNLSTVTYRQRNNDDNLTQNNDNPNVHDPISKRTSNLQENDLSSTLINRKNSTDDDDGTVSIQGIKPKTKSRNPFIIFNKKNPNSTSKKSKQQKSNIDNDEFRSNPSISTAPTVAKLILQPLTSSVPVPPVPPREDIPSEQDEIDEDEVIQLKSYSTIAKIIPKPQPRNIPPQQSSKLNTDNLTDEDSGESKQKRPKADRKTKTRHKISAVNDDDDDDGRRIAKTNDTIKRIIPSKQPVLDNLTTAINDPSSDITDDDDKQSSKHQPDPNSISYDTVDQIRNTKVKETAHDYHYDAIPTEDEHAIQATTSHTPPSYNQASHATDLYRLRTISYRAAHEKTPPLVPHRSSIFSITSGHNSINDDSSHCSEITNDTIRSGVNNRSYSKIGSFQLLSNRSNKQQTSEQQESNEDINVETKEEEEEEEKQEQDHLLESQPASLPNEPTALSSDTHSDKPKHSPEVESIKRRKRMRFRWHLAYTIINNYRLFDLRKRAQGRLILLHLQRSNLISEQQYAALNAVQEPVATKTIDGLPRAYEQGLISEVPRSPMQRPPIMQRLISVTVPIFDEYPQSPAERYIAIRSRMLYDANAQQPTTPHSSSGSQVPTTASVNNQQFRPSMTANFSRGSQGFEYSSNINVYPPSENSMKSREDRARRALQQGNLTPVFLPVSPSNQSTDDYPIAGASSTANSAVFRTQMSYDQHMDVWRQNKVNAIQKKQRHCYIYGTPLQPTVTDDVSTAAILTPHILSTTARQQKAPPTPNNNKPVRSPTNPPFEYPLTTDEVRNISSSTINNNQFEKINEKPKRKRRQKKNPAPPQRMDRVNEDPQKKI